MKHSERVQDENKDNTTMKSIQLSCNSPKVKVKITFHSRLSQGAIKLPVIVLLVYIQFREEEADGIIAQDTR